MYTVKGDLMRSASTNPTNLDVSQIRSVYLPILDLQTGAHIGSEGLVFSGLRTFDWRGLFLLEGNWISY